MSLEELFYFVIGLMIIYMVYWQIFNANEETHKATKHNEARYSRGFVLEPHKLLINYGEAVGMIYGEEE
tara:strand:- start:184 stop:390 length:207 start_codon:yes stop_codon:yes gene_type:complete